MQVQVQVKSPEEVQSRSRCEDVKMCRGAQVQKLRSAEWCRGALVHRLRNGGTEVQMCRCAEGAEGAEVLRC